MVKFGIGTSEEQGHWPSLFIQCTRRECALKQVSPGRLGVFGMSDALIENVLHSCLLRGHHLRLGVVHRQREAHAKIGRVGAGHISGVPVLYLRSHTS